MEYAYLMECANAEKVLQVVIVVYISAKKIAIITVVAIRIQANVNAMRIMRG
jgi:hypothetical protein